MNLKSWMLKLNLSNIYLWSLSGYKVKQKLFNLKQIKIKIT